MPQRFWFEFAGEAADELPPGLVMGCGVTADTYAEAVAVIRDRVFGGARLPPVRRVMRDIDVSTLDPAHVRPNMGNPAVVGIWFPQGY